MGRFDKTRMAQIIMGDDIRAKEDLIEDLCEQLREQKLGLVWERGGSGVAAGDGYEVETVVTDYRTTMPIARYERELSRSPREDTIGFSMAGATAPALHSGNLLLEGDNYVWLKVLEQTHKGRIDVIYIDPPYNTGHNDFAYNDTYIDRSDAFSHSKWIDFINRRLKIARTLLADSGVIFVSIDMNEQAYLQVLLNEIFGEDNCLATISVVNNQSGRSDSAFFATSTEFLLVYAKDASQARINGFPLDDRYLSQFGLSDEYGSYKESDLKKTGKNCRREDRPNMYYPIYWNPNKNTFELERHADDDIEIFPPDNTDGSQGCWRWGAGEGEKFQTHNTSQYLVCRKMRDGRYRIKVKDRPGVAADGKTRSIKPKTHWDKPEYSTSSGGKVLKALGFDASTFPSAKSVEFLGDIMRISTSSDSIILDFFAGSGTTAQAVEELNAEDGGNRRWILVTNNEGESEEDASKGIMRSVTKPRIDTVLTGIRPDGTRYSDGTGSGYDFFTIRTSQEFDREGNATEPKRRGIPRDMTSSTRASRIESNRSRYCNDPRVLNGIIRIRFDASHIGGTVLTTGASCNAYLYDTDDMSVVLIDGAPDTKAVDECIEWTLATNGTKPITLVMSDHSPAIYGAGILSHDDSVEVSVITHSQLLNDEFFE